MIRMAARLRKVAEGARQSETEAHAGQQARMSARCMCCSSEWDQACVCREGDVGCVKDVVATHGHTIGDGSVAASCITPHPVVEKI